MAIDNFPLWHASLRHPAGNIPLPEGEPCMTMYKCVFLALRHFFLFWPRVFSRALGSVARREPARTPRASLGPGRGPRHVLWGSKWQVPSGRDSEHVEPSRPMQTHVHNTFLTWVKKCPTAHAISMILNVTAARHYLVTEKYFSDT